MSSSRLLSYFSYEHLPERLQHISKPFCELAEFVDNYCPGEEGEVALRKLLEAKDCAVRSLIPTHNLINTELKEAIREVVKQDLVVDVPGVGHYGVIVDKDY